MRIAQISPLIESVPPKLYGGTERAVGYLTETLIEMGHEVTLFASGDSQTRAELEKICPKALRLADCIDFNLPNILELQRLIERADEFDVIHFHTDHFHLPLSRLMKYPHLTTLHGSLDAPDLQNLYQTFSELPFVSISHNQRRPLDKINWLGNVYHGLPQNLYQPSLRGGDYAVFLGRICPEKRLDRAIEITRKAGIPLKVAAKIDRLDKIYFEREIEPLMSQPHVEFIGEVGEDKKNDLLAQAKVLLFPIDWEEPFGLVMIEALACGTPVVAYDMGSVTEVLEEGKTGFIVRSVNEAVSAVKKVDQISRRHCRQAFEERFTAQRMAEEYVKLYERVCRETEVTPFSIIRLRS